LKRRRLRGRSKLAATLGHVKRIDWKD
jgi:hypothetical protein